MGLIESLPGLSLLAPLAVIWAYLEILKIIADRAARNSGSDLSGIGKLTAI